MIINHNSLYVEGEIVSQNAPFVHYQKQKRGAYQTVNALGFVSSPVSSSLLASYIIDHSSATQPMGKGAANLWRYAQVGRQVNYRYLNAQAYAQPTGKAIAELEGLCHPQGNQGQRYARFNPITQADCDLFSATLAGEHACIVSLNL